MQMKRTCRLPASLLLALLLLLGCAAPALAADGLTVSAGKAGGLPGTSVSLDITVSSNPGISGMSLKIDYDHDALTLTGMENLAGGSFSPNLSKGILSWLLGRNTSAEGSYFTLTFAVSASAAPGTYPITLSLTEGEKKNIVNENAEPVPASFAAGSVTVMSAGAAEGLCHPFTDVQTTDWFHEAVDYVWQNGLMNGMGDDLFEPATTTSRAMVVTVLHRMEGSPASGAESVFTDVAPGEWYAEAVAWANENGIVLGYGDGRFGPRDAVTREQMVTILYRYLLDRGQAAPAEGSLDAFADRDEVSDWALDAMRWAVGTGLVNGRAADTLVPRSTATRAEIATLFMRFRELFLK
jgi:hypothetical protein